MLKKNIPPTLLILSLSLIAMQPLKASADIGLMLYDAMMADPYITNAGHNSVYLSNICMTEQLNKFRVCTDEDHENGITGTMVQRYSNLVAGREKGKQVDWIALPLNYNIYGNAEPAKAPILVTPKVLQAERTDAYHDDALHLSQFMTPVKSKKETVAPEIPDGNWQYAIGVTALRSAHLISLATTPEEDQRVVDYLNNSPNISNFNNFWRNCANFAADVFRVAKGKTYNGHGYIEDVGAITPSSNAKAVKKIAMDAGVPYTIRVYNQTPGTYKSSSTPSEMSTDSNSNLAVSQLVRLVPFPGSLIFTGLKFARKLGMPLPGYRPYMDVAGKETLQHATPELAEATLDLQTMKKASHDKAADKDAMKSEISDAKEAIVQLQDQEFGTAPCWSMKRASFKDAMARAVAHGIIDEKFAKLLEVHADLNAKLRMIPMVHMNPNHSKLVTLVANDTDSQIETHDDGLVLIKNGSMAGLTRNNILNYDQRLGFLIMASSVSYQLDTGKKVVTSEFDADWNMMMAVGKNAGMAFSRGDEVSVRGCSTGERSSSSDLQ